MKRPIDLMPNSYRRRLGMQRLRSLYLKAGLGLAIICGGLFLHGRQVVSSCQARAGLLAKQVAELESIRARANARNAVADDLQSRLDDYNRLALPIEPSEVVAMIGAALHRDLVLTDLKMNVINRRPSTSALERLRRPGKGSGKEPAEVRRVLAVEVSGLGFEGVHVAQLIGRLENNPGIQNVQLEYDRIKKIDETPMREFCVRIELDLETVFIRRLIPVVDEHGASLSEAPSRGEMP